MSQSSLNKQLNRQNFLFKRDAERVADRLLSFAFATRVGVEKDDDGYWLNVWWKCGIIAPLTINETNQAYGEK
tara:strand:+ start:79 stop:297 length:219 start_codon:yes stop_codon:yes gene_type:complete